MHSRARDALSVSRATQLVQRETDRPEHAVLDVAGLKRSVVRKYRVNMAYHDDHGWQLTSKFYDERPM